jgi:hypothetical protein
MSTWELPCEERDFSFFSPLFTGVRGRGILGS